MTDITPTYVDEENGTPRVLNKITLAPRTDREYTYRLEPHVGKDRKKDAKLLAFVSKLQGSVSEAGLLLMASESDEFETLALQALDLDEKPNTSIADTLTFMDLLQGFMAAIEFRTGGMQEPEVDEAVKK